MGRALDGILNFIGVGPVEDDARGGDQGDMRGGGYDHNGYEDPRSARGGRDRYNGGYGDYDDRGRDDRSERGGYRDRYADDMDYRGERGGRGGGGGGDRGKRGGGKVVNHPAAQGPEQHKVRIYMMEDFNDTRVVIDELLQDRSVFINLEDVQGDEGQRIVDMLSGATYALGASFKKVAVSTYLLAPDTVDVVGSYEEEDRRGRSSFFGGGRGR